MEKCTNCKYSGLDDAEYPCNECDLTNISKWEPADNVNHPKHYSECSIECIEAMQIAFGKHAVYDFCICNAFKYLWRYKNKNGGEDLKKAMWYLNKAQSMGLFEEDSTIKDLREILEEHRK